MTPEPRLKWTPGPSGVPVPPTLDDLIPRLGRFYGPNGTSWETGVGGPDGMPVLLAVYRIDSQPVGILSVKLLDGTPEYANIAVHPEHQRQGIGRSLCECALEHGVDLRELGAIWDESLTAEGRALRDGLAGNRDRYGFASWETQEATA